MGTIILIIAALIEIAFGVYCIATKSNQKRTRSWVRISAFATFAIFTLVSVIEWSFRWIPLFAILLVWAVLGAWSLIRTKLFKNESRKVKEYKPARIVLKAIAICLIIVIAVTPALILPQHRSIKVTGKYDVKTVTYTCTDNSRVETFTDTGENRKVTFEFWYPENAEGTYPLVVFSHGAFGIRASNTSTYTELASNGYIVCSIDHPYHSMYTKDTDGNITIGSSSFRQEITDVNSGVYSDEDIYKLEKKWMKVRTGDMNFVLNTIIKNAKDNNSDKVYQLIDTGKIGLIGHSLGGAASAQLGRERKDINAVINLDGDLLGEYVDFVDGKNVVNNEVYPVPILTIYTDTMKQAKEEALITDPDYIIPQKLIVDTAPDAYEVYMSGTNHLSLTDLPIVSPFLASMLNSSTNYGSSKYKADKYYVIEKMNSIVLEFFDCYLKGEGSFQSAGTY